MSNSALDVLDLARLAGITLLPEELPTLERDLRVALASAEQLPPLDNSQQQCDHLSLHALRPDEVRAGLPSGLKLGALCTGQRLLVPTPFPPAEES